MATQMAAGTSANTYNAFISNHPILELQSKTQAEISQHEDWCDCLYCSPLWQSYFIVNLFGQVCEVQVISQEAQRHHRRPQPNGKDGAAEQRCPNFRHSNLAREFRSEQLKCFNVQARRPLINAASNAPKRRRSKKSLPNEKHLEKGCTSKCLRLFDAKSKSIFDFIFSTLAAQRQHRNVADEERRAAELVVLQGVLMTRFNCVESDVEELLQK